MNQIMTPAGDPSKNGFAVVSMIIGIVGLVLILFFPIIFIPVIGWIIAIVADLVVLISSIIGLILGVKGKQSQNRGIAIAGIVLCSIVLVLYIIPLIIFIGFLFFGLTLFGGLGISSLM